MDKAKTKASTKQLTGVGKRQQIDAANKLIFIWVAVAAVAVSFCLVALQFLVSQGLFNQKIISAMGETNQALEHNLVVADELKANVEKLLANSALQSVATADTDNNLQVVLDALPTVGDATNFSTSLQNIILVDSGASVAELATQGKADDFTDSSLTTDEELATAKELPFSASIVGDFKQTKTTFIDMSQVIRPIDVKSLDIIGQNNKLRTTMTGVTYYLPAETTELGTKEIKP